MQPNRVVATAMFRVSRVPPTMLGDWPRQHDVAEFEVVKKSQIAALRSYFVLQSAIRKPGIASLPTFAGRNDPVEWLQDNLLVEFPEDGEYLSISLEGVEDDSADLIRIVDAVAKAYSDEVLFVEKQKQLGERDLLASTLEDVNSELQKKMDEFIDIAREADRSEGESGDAMQELIMKRLDRVDSELMRLEEEQLRAETSGEAGNPKFYEERIAQLRKRQEELEARIRTRSEKSVELTVRTDEIARLRRIADELASKRERLEIESNAPPRITQVQSAVVSPAD
jgi:myosin heavy subunit